MNRTVSAPSGFVAFGRSARSLWAFDPELVFLNHGSFGAVPRELLDHAAERRREIERNPVEGVWRHGFPGIRSAATVVADFLGSEPDRTGFVTNATAGINAMLQSLPLDAGDEVLHLDQGYNAVWQTILLTARRRGIIPRRIELPLPLAGPDDAVAAIERSLSSRTRLLVLDQITSPTALVLPVERIVAMAASHGVDTIVDGAHAPGMVAAAAAPASAALAWTGNLHKWPCSLRGTAVVTAREDVAAIVKPAVISHHLDQSFAAEFDWQGTVDPTPWLLAPDAIAFMDRFGGWDAVRTRNRELTIEMHGRFVERFGVEPISPLDGSMLGFMATIELPRSLQPEHGGPAFSSSNAVPGPDGRPMIGMDDVQRRLLEEHRIEVPVVVHGGRRFVRFSVHVYNDVEDYERLADAVMTLADA
jgi:isopenicillin-N epimerase